jgi:hypothetical protein
LVDDDILPTVSRRDLRRRLANVRTSGNRIFRTHNPQLILEAAISCAGEAMGSGVQPTSGALFVSVKRWSESPPNCGRWRPSRNKKRAKRLP